MKDTTLYEHLLGLKSPWSVKSVDLSLVDQRVVVEVVLKPGQKTRGHILYHDVFRLNRFPKQHQGRVSILFG